MKRIILDTNALMAFAEFKLDVFSAIKECCDFQYKVVVLSGIVDELKKIKEEQRGKYKLAAKLALSLLNARKIEVVKSKGLVDDLLVEYSRKGYLILTQDIALKRRLKKPYMTIRQKKKVIVVK